MADIKLTNEKIDYSKYDLLHFFNITRPADILYHLEKSSLPPIGIVNWNLFLPPVISRYV